MSEVGHHISEQVASPSRFLRHRQQALRAQSRQRSRQRDQQIQWRQARQVDHRPWFCALAIIGCVGVFLLEVQANGWVLQPFLCPSTTSAGLPAYDDGTPCEGNLMLGPTIAVLDALGAKNDVKIFEGGEWWRFFTCNWMHAGVIHLLLNAGGILVLGVGLERAFGFWRAAFLYIASGLFGSITSAIFLPGVISVGASASMFGLLGAYWADVLLNHVAKCSLRGAGIGGLLLATVPNLLMGFTPWVDNFMHLGGLFSGMLIGVLLSAHFQLHWPHQPSSLQPKASARSPVAPRPPTPRHSGGVCVLCRPAARAAVRLARRGRADAAAVRSEATSALIGLRRLKGLGRSQRLVALGSLVLLLSLTALAVTVATEATVQQVFRACEACLSLNCIEIDWFTSEPWWSCCVATLPGKCTLEFEPSSNRTVLSAMCNVSGVAPFAASCNITTDPRCEWDPNDAASASVMCKRLCMDC